MLRQKCPVNRRMFHENNHSGLIYMNSDVLGVKNAFTTRFGGVSTGIFASLNLGSNIGDPQENVAENYRRVCAVMGAGINDCAVTKQVHGGEVRIVTEADRHVCGEDIPYAADGIVTEVKGMPLMCFTADCTPVLLSDPVHGIAAAVHCGWRGSCADIIANAVDAMCSLGATAEEIRAAMGPAIGGCCFETDADVPKAVDAWIGEKNGCWSRREDGKYLVDLRRANALRLRQKGILPEHIDISEECTMCSHEKYWSHRYTRGKRGVQCAAIVL